jgi:chorismate synthase
MLRYTTAGESHGKALVSVVEGIPKGLTLDINFINNQLKARMEGPGRGGRMRIEKDKVEILSGVRGGKTLGSPIAMLIQNKDFKIESLHSISNPRPGHADLAGAMKFAATDIRDILERASARETASRVSVGAVVKLLLRKFNIHLVSRVIAVGGMDVKFMRRAIENARKNKDTLGGIFEVVIKGAPPGLGSYAQWDQRLSTNLAGAIMSIPSVKGVEIGAGFMLGRMRGSEAQDEIFYDRGRKKFFRKTNNAGGIEGGITNGEDIIIRAAMKPIATLPRPLESVNLRTKKKARAQVERADICVVSSGAVIAEAMCAIEIGRAMKEKFGGDSLVEMKRNFKGYIKQIKAM